MANLPTQASTAFLYVSGVPDVSNNSTLVNSSYDHFVYGITALNKSYTIDAIQLFLVNTSGGGTISVNVAVLPATIYNDDFGQTDLVEKNESLKKLFTRTDNFGNEYMSIPSGFALKANFEGIATPSDLKIVCHGFRK